MAGLSLDDGDDAIRRSEFDFRSRQWTDYRSILHGSGNFNAPFGSTRNRFTPAVQFLIHANIKATFEYQFRPSQSVVVATNPLTGLPMAFNPFHTNTAVIGLDFAY